tara:strand:+ start:19 stop:291 length:273 start_codon:yes stop_codon:yes gene_type:complete
MSNKKNIETNLLKIFSKQLKLDSLTKKKLELNKIDLKLNEHENWDSLKHVSILIELENKFKVKVDSKNINLFSSYKLILNLLKNTKHGSH